MYLKSQVSLYHIVNKKKKKIYIYIKSLFFIFFDFPVMIWLLSEVPTPQLTSTCNAGFNDAFIVPTVAGGVPRDG